MNCPKKIFNNLKRFFVFLTIFSLLISSPGFEHIYAQEKADGEVDLASPSAQLEKFGPIDPTPIISQTSSKAPNSPNPEIEEEAVNGSAKILDKRVRILEKKNLLAKEKAKVFLTNTKLDEIDIKLIDSEGENSTFLVDQEIFSDVTVLNISPSYEFKPGKYKLVVKDEDGNEIAQDFTWGVLAINPNKFLYKTGETAKLAIAVLDEDGNMDCKAKVSLEVVDPNGDKKTLSTSDASIKVNPECSLKKKTDKPDYEADYQVEKEGTYNLNLTAETENGTFIISDVFKAQEDPSFDVERISATRIYPYEEYEMKINITAKEDFEGVISEVVPISFSLNQLEGSDFQYTSISSISASINDERVLGADVVNLKMPFKENYAVSQGFGDIPDEKELQQEYEKLGLKSHDGIDFALPEETEVLAADSGVIKLAKENSDYGNTIVIEHEWGNTYYGHLNELEVKEGQEIKRGERIGFSGNTGLSTGPHLHFSVRPKNYDFNNGFFGKEDPAPYLNLSSKASSNQFKIQKIKWKVNLKKGERYQIGYTYRAPLISPEFYLTGPLRLISNDNLVFEEGRLWQIAADATITYVGGITGKVAGSTGTNLTIALNALNGGIGKAPQTGDLIIVTTSTGSAADRSIGPNSGQGYSELITELYSNGTSYDTNLDISWKFAGSTPDTQVVIGPSGNNADAISATVQVWRNVDSNTPFDVATQVASGTATGRPTPPQISPSTTGAVIVAVGAGAALTGALYTSTSLAKFLAVTQADTTDSMTGMGTYYWSGGTYTPAQFAGGTANAADSWAAATLALRPATGADSGIVYVGGASGKAAGSTGTNLTISLTNLGGGGGSRPQTGDLIVVVTSTGATADRSIGPTTGQGYAELITELYSNGTSYDTNLDISWKFAGSTPDTQVVIGPSGNNADAIGATVQVWRNINSSTPFDVTTQVASGTATGRPTPPQISPSTTGAVIVAVGAGAATTGAVYTSTTLADFVSVTQADTTDSMTGMGLYYWSSGTYTPAQFAGGTANTGDSWAAATLVLKPASGASGITLSGTIFQTSESQAYDCSGGNTLTVQLRANGSGTYNATCTTNDGHWSISNINTADNQTIVAYLDGGSVRGSLIFVTNNSAISDYTLPIYQNRIILRDDNNGSITNGEIHAGQTSDSENDDLYDSTSSTFTTTSSTYETHINSGDTYSPGGSVTTGKLHIPSTATYTGNTETLTLTGSGQTTARPIYNQGTFSAFSAPINTSFTGTSASDIEVATYQNLTFAPTSGSPIYSFMSGTSTVNSNFTIGDGTNAVTGRTTGNNPTITVLGNLEVKSNAILDGSGTGTISIGGDITGGGIINLSAGTFEHRANGDVNFGSSSGSNDWTFNNLTYSNLSSGSSFGDNTSSQTSYIIGDPGDIQVRKFTLTEKARINSLSIYASGPPSGNSQVYKLVIYEDTLGTPGLFRGQTVEGTLSTSDSSYAWRTLNSNGTIDLTAGDYWIGVWTGATASQMRWGMGPSTGAEMYAVASGTYSSSGNPADFFPAGGITATYMARIYANYTPYSEINFSSDGSGQIIVNGDIQIGKETDTGVIDVNNRIYGTFGNTTEETGTVMTWNNEISYARFTLSESGYVTKLHALIDNQGTSHVATAMRGSLYAADRSGLPGTRLGLTNEIKIVDNKAKGWVEASLTEPVYLNSGDYVIAWQFPASGVGVRTYRNASGGIAGWKSDTYSDGPENPSTLASWNDATYKYAYYATYYKTTGSKDIDTNNFLITLRGKFEGATGADLKIAGNYTNNGTFVSGNGTVTFDSSSISTITYGSSASNTFYGLSVNTAGKQLKFDKDQTTRITGSLTIQGTNCTTERIFLDSELDNDNWPIDVTGATLNIDYIDLEDSAGTGSPVADNSTQENGGNTGWTVNVGSCGAGTSPTNDQLMRHGKWFNTSGERQKYTF